MMPQLRFVLPARLLRLALFALVLLALPIAAGAATFKVGVGSGCTHTTLADAFLAASGTTGPDEIRLLAGSTHVGPISVIANPVWLIGGFSSCTASTPTGFSTLQGSTTSPALLIVSAVNTATYLRRLTIVGASAATGDGAGLSISGLGYVELDAVQIFNGSTSGRGGNLWISTSSGLTVWLRNGSLLASGHAQHGGGLACSGGAEVRLDETSAIANNQATGDGGGVYLQSSCNFYSYAGGNLAGISTNIAARGGGIYLESQANATLTGTARALAAVSGNNASSGGGIYATGTGSIFRAYSGAVTGNTASAAGGGMYLINGAGAYMTRSVASAFPCPDGDRCSQLSDNDAPVGGALYLASNADATLESTFVERNSTTIFSSIASLVSDCSLELRSCVLAANDGPTPFGLSGALANRLIFGNVTMVGNTNVGAALISVENAADTVEVLTSAFSQSGRLFLALPSGFAPLLDCVMTAQANLLTGPLVGRAVVVNDPLLESASKAYQLQGASPAIDFCDQAHWAFTGLDAQGDVRDYDDPFHPNAMVGGFRDLGADEVVRLFADGFESGNTAAWSETVPLQLD